jgi:small subunit ribosomal protein S6
MKRQYELGLVISPDLNDEQLDAILERIGQVIEHQEGEIVHLDRWGRRRMAYPIERHREGYYVFIEVRMDSESVHEVEQFVHLQEAVMRSLLIAIDPRALEERKRRKDQDAARLAMRAAQIADAANAAAAQAEAGSASVAVAEAPEAEAPEADAPVAETPEVEAPSAEPETPAATASPDAADGDAPPPADEEAPE